jgi:amino acid adenylation domain-containing protein
MRSTKPKLLHGILEDRAADRADDIAVRDRNGSLTYHDLDRRSLRLAASLRSRGVSLDTPVGVCATRSVDLVVAFFGILRAGGAYVPLDPANPTDRLDWMIRDAGLTLVVTDTRHRDLLPHSAANLLIDQDRADPELAWEPISEQPSDSLAYIIYTSGSTGRPKGVMVSHRNALGLVSAQRESGLVPMGSNILGFAPIGFDASIWEILLAVGHGAPLHYVDGIDDLPAVENCVATLVPSVLELLDPSSMNFSHVVSVGERLDASVAERWSRTVAVSNAYGPAEATVWATLSERLTHFSEEPGIGRARSGCTVYLVDGSGRLVAPGEVGELCIGGNGVSRGYLGQPGLTASRFQPDPWGPAGSRLYRTGDLARQRPDGTYEFRGRIDDQVKIGGRRVELGEIECALRTLQGVEDARVVLGKTQEGGRRLVAAVKAGNLAGTDEQITKSLKGQLPEHMVPTSIFRVDSFPLTVNGKLDSARLLEQMPAPDMGRGFDHPAKSLVAALWASALDVPHIGPDDNFFSLGGHSLSASRLIARLRSTLQVPIPIRSLFQSPVLHAFLNEVVEPAIQESRVPDDDRTYWRELLGDLPDVSDIPILWRAPDSSFAELPWTDFSVPLDVVEAARAVARRELVTPFMVYVAAFGVALCHQMMVSETVIGVSNRVRRSGEEPASTLLVRVASPDAAVADAVSSVRSGIIEAYRHQDFPDEIPADSMANHSGHVVPGFLISMKEPGVEHEPARCAFHLELTAGIDGISGAIRVAPQFSDRCEKLREFHDTYLAALRGMRE